MQYKDDKVLIYYLVSSNQDGCIFPDYCFYDAISTTSTAIVYLDKFL